MPAQHNHLRAIGYAMTGFTLWVLADTCVKLAGETSLPPHEVIAFLGLVSALVMILKAGAQKKLRVLRPKKPRAMLLPAFMALGCNYANVIALKHLTLALFFATVFTAPLVIAIVASVLLKEKLSLPKWAAIIAGFVGVLIAVNPFGDFNGGDWVGVCAATFSVGCFTVSTVWLRVLTQSESSDSVAFSIGLIEAIVGFALMLVQATPVDWYILGILTAMGIFCVSGNLCNFIALRLTTAAAVEQFHYSQIITGALLGFVIWRDVPSWPLVTGAVIIIASGLYIAAHTRKAENQAAVGVH